jgi:type II restriction enzyme
MEKAMTQKKQTFEHLKSNNDLITTYEATRAGFISLALEKNRKATPTVNEAKALRNVIIKCKNPKELLKLPEIKPALLTAAGLSDKAIKQLQPEDTDTAIKELIKNFLEPVGNNFVEELIYRFLLTKGDSLGGSMRNIIGALAQQKLTNAIVANLNLFKMEFYWYSSQKNDWINAEKIQPDINNNLKALSWTYKRQKRTVVYNYTVPLVKNNIDICLLDCNHMELQNAQHNYDRYIALGELKGGIDPAGADEHWKTASTALARIRGAFAKEKLYPVLFFIGAAIENKMSMEIWEQLLSGQLSNAANLTKLEQLNSLCAWLIDL